MPKKPKKKKRKKIKPSRFTAATADKNELYELSVQNVESEIDFVDATYKEIRGRYARKFREDFCGTGNTSVEWIGRRKTNTAVGLDIDQTTLDWGIDKRLQKLSPKDRERITLLNCNVLEPKPEAKNMDCVLAMNFSYWLFKTRPVMLKYFKKVRESLNDDGIFFLDHYGGSEAMEEQEEIREIEDDDGSSFDYVWDQDKYYPITSEVDCKIHFRFPDGTEMKDAYVYTWRLWGLKEIQELLDEAGYKKVTVYWEGDDPDSDEGNGEFVPELKGEACPAFVSYIAAEK